MHIQNHHNLNKYSKISVVCVCYLLDLLKVFGALDHVTLLQNIKNWEFIMLSCDGFRSTLVITIHV